MTGMKEKIKNLNPITKFLPIIIVIQFLPMLKVLLKDGKPSISGDSAFYQHAGWYNLNGGIPYETIWDPKPPLNFVYTTFTAFIGRDNMIAIHYINILSGVLVTVLICWIVGLIVYEMTDNREASIISSLFCVAFPVFHELFATGYRPKYPFLLFGLLGILLALKDYPLISMFSASLSTGFWHFGIIMMVSTFFIISNNGRKLSDLSYAFIGTLFGTIVVISPAIIWGSFEAMLISTIFSPFMSEGGGSIVLNIGIIVANLKYLNILVFFSVGGLIINGIDDIRNSDMQNIWLYILVICFSLQVLVIDFDSIVDFMPLYVILSFGLGLIYIKVSKNIRHILWGLIIVSIIITTVFGGGSGYIFEDYSKTDSGERSNALWDNSLRDVGSIFLGNISFNDYGSNNEDIPKLNQRSYMDDIYWEKIKPGVCHYRVGNMHKQWMENTNQSYEDKKCLNDLNEFISEFIL